jgi:PAS domain S-box-containing protein
MAFVAANPNRIENVLRRTPGAYAVVDLGSRTLSPNADFAALLRLEGQPGAARDLTSLVPANELGIVDGILNGLRSGAIESCQSRMTLRGASGHVDTLAWFRPLDDERPAERALLVVVPAGGDTPSPSPWMARVDTKSVVFGSLDHEWRVRDASPDGARLLGWDAETFIGSAFQTIVHPDDVPLLLLTLGRSSSDGCSVATRVRVRSGGQWIPVRCAVSPLCEHNPPRYSFGLWMYAEDEGASDGDRAAYLEGHLSRIAAEVEAAGISDLPRVGDAWWADPALRGLTERQLEILRLVIAGEGTPAIARSLFLSQSTVRNHLASIYRRTGVHSKAELVARLLRSR